MLESKISFPNIAGITNSMNWSLNGYDLYILLFFATVVLLCFFFLRHKVFVLLFGIYISYLIILFFPFNLWFKNSSLELTDKIKVWGFVGLIIILTFIFSRCYIFVRQSGGIIKVSIRSLFYGVLNAGLFLSLLILLLPLNWLSKFSGTSLNILSSDIGRFVWIILPIVLILFLNKKRKGPGRPSFY
ncbi:hypothetical protein L6278_00330 [Candidatus Parcubacteria bacterium]|nr:hypothetical protein [Patescibacteria group bacterium]MBU4482101.1 hypothetical protein [Patescibacteria group bacterium]MCG2686565.1 hypothetical protein [Candidatus Parcubacteria bacterium]